MSFDITGGMKSAVMHVDIELLPLAGFTTLYLVLVIVREIFIAC